MKQKQVIFALLAAMAVGVGSVQAATAKWYSNGAEIASQEAEAGTALNIPTEPTEEPEEGYTFAGWTTAPIEGKTAVAPVYVNTAGLQMPENDVNYYAVFARAERKTVIANPNEAANISLYQDQNEAAKFGLDAEQWSVVGNPGGCANNVALTNDDKGKLIRMYLSGTTGRNTLSITAPETIVSVRISFSAETFSQMWLKVNDEEVAANDGEYAINAQSFVIGVRNDATAQVRITQIDVVFAAASYATGFEKADPGIAWSAATATAYTVGKTYTLPTLTNALGLAVTYSSETPATATISNEAGHEGEVTLVAAGTTTIKATFAGNDDYKATEVSYTLTVYAPATVVVTGEANKTQYYYNEIFSFEGLGAKATYADETEYDIPAEAITWTPDPAPAIIISTTIEVTATWQGLTSETKEIAVTKKLRTLSYDEFAWSSYDTEYILLGYSPTPAVRSIRNDRNLPAELFWFRSGDGSVMSVDRNTGVITPNAMGYASMIVEFSGNEEYAPDNRSYPVLIYRYDHIELKGEATKTAYEKGDDFDRTGIRANAIYKLTNQGDWILNVSELAEWTIEPTTVEADGEIPVIATWNDKTSDTMNIAVTVNKHKVTITQPENGNVVVKNGETPISSGDEFAKGTQLTIAVVPTSADYKAGKVIVDGEPSEGTSVVVQTEDIEISGQIIEKTTPTFRWSADAATYYIIEENADDLPDFIPDENCDVAFVSTNTGVATINDKGTVSPKAVGTTEIKAVFAGDDTYKAKTASYTLTVAYDDSPSTGVEEVMDERANGRKGEGHGEWTKVLENGVLYLKHEGNMYNVQGLRVK